MTFFVFVATVNFPFSIFHVFMTRRKSGNFSKLKNDSIIWIHGENDKKNWETKRLKVFFSLLKLMSIHRIGGILRVIASWNTFIHLHLCFGIRFFGKIFGFFVIFLGFFDTFSSVLAIFFGILGPTFRFFQKNTWDFEWKNLGFGVKKFGNLLAKIWVFDEEKKTLCIKVAFCS